MKKSLIIGLILIFVCLGLTIYNELKYNRGYDTNIHDITNKGLKKENVKVYLNATYIGGALGGEDNKDNSYYVIFGDNVQYIVYMNNKKADEINRYLLDNDDKSYQITGITKIIPESMEDNIKQFVKKWLDLNHHHEEGETHSHDITPEQMYQYFGYVYLDNIVNNLLLRIIIYVTGTIGVLLVISFIIRKYHFI